MKLFLIRNGFLILSLNISSQRRLAAPYAAKSRRPLSPLAAQSPPFLGGGGGYGAGAGGSGKKARPTRRRNNRFFPLLPPLCAARVVRIEGGILPSSVSSLPSAREDLTLFCPPLAQGVRVTRAPSNVLQQIAKKTQFNQVTAWKTAKSSDLSGGSE